MTITVDNNWDDRGLGATFTFTTGSAPTEGKLLIAVIVKWYGLGNKYTVVPDAADNWNELFSAGHGNAATGIYWKIAEAAEDTTFDFSHTGGPSIGAIWACGMIEISGFDPSDPIDDFQSTTGSTTSPFVAPSVLTENINELIVSGFGVEYQNGVTYYAIDGDLAEQWNLISSASPSFTDVVTAAGTELQAAEGNSGTYTHETDATGFGGYVAFTIAVTNGEVVVDANVNSQTFTALDATVNTGGFILANVNSQTFTALDAVTAHDLVLSLEGNDQFLESKNITVSYSPHVSAELSSQTFTALNAVTSANGIVTATVNTQVFTALDVIIDHPAVIEPDVDAQTFTAFDADVFIEGHIAVKVNTQVFEPLNITVFIPQTSDANSQSMVFESLNAEVTGIFVGEVAPGIWPDERDPTGSIIGIGA